MATEKNLPTEAELKNNLGLVALKAMREYEGFDAILGDVVDAGAWLRGLIRSYARLDEGVRDDGDLFGDISDQMEAAARRIEELSEAYGQMRADNRETVRGLNDRLSRLESELEKRRADMEFVNNYADVMEQRVCELERVVEEVGTLGG